MSQSISKSPATRWFVGFFGALIAVAVLPRTMLYLTRRVAGRLVAEALAIVLLGLISDRVSPRRPRSTRKRS